MYTQLCVLQGIADPLPDLKPLLEAEFGIRVQMAEEFTTTPDSFGPGGRRDVLFYVHDEDVQRFAIPRLQYGIRWWEDVLLNGPDHVPAHIVDKYPDTWNA